MENITDDKDILDLIDRIDHGERKIYNVEDCFDYFTKEQFIQIFRLSKNTSRVVINQIRNQIMLPTER